MVQASAQDIINDFVVFKDQQVNLQAVICMHETETCGFLILELLRLFLDIYEINWTKTWKYMHKLVVIFNPLPTTWRVAELKTLAPRHFQLLELVDFFFKKQLPQVQLPIIEGDFVKVERLCVVACNKVISDNQIYNSFREHLKTFRDSSYTSQQLIKELS